MSVEIPQNVRDAIEEAVAPDLFVDSSSAERVCAVIESYIEQVGWLVGDGMHGDKLQMFDAKGDELDPLPRVFRFLSEAREVVEIEPTEEKPTHADPFGLGR